MMLRYSTLLGLTLALLPHQRAGAQRLTPAPHQDAALALSGQSHPGARPTLATRSTETIYYDRSGTWRDLFSPDGRKRGELERLAEGTYVHLTAREATSFWGPAYRNYFIGSDSRTVVGVGNLSNSLRPRFVQLEVFRDGTQVFKSEPDLVSDTRVAIDATGLVLICSSRSPGEASQLVSIRNIDGSLLFATEVDDARLTQLTPVRGSFVALRGVTPTELGELYVFDGVTGRRIKLPIPAQRVSGLASSLVLCWGPDQMACVEITTGRTIWKRDIPERPISSHGIVLCPENDSFLLMTAGLPSLGEPLPAIHVREWDLKSGAELSFAITERRGPLSEAHLECHGDRIQLRWCETLQTLARELPGTNEVSR